MRGLSFWIIVFILVFSPLPFASVRPVWSHLYAVLVAVGLLAYVFDRWRAGRAMPGVPWPLGIAGILMALVALWGYLQAVPGLFPAWQHPVWAETASVLGDPSLKGYLSLTPERTLTAAIKYLSYIGFGLLVVWHARRQRNVELLLKIFVAAQAGYALYGLSVYFSGLETILWFDKTAYRGFLTSTFVNRNSYATYAGLGVLASLALVLHYLRQTLVAEKSHRTKLREFVETLTSRGWLPPMVMLMCFVAVLLTGSRMGLTAMLVASSLLLAAWTARLQRGQARTLGSLLLGVMLGLLLFNFVLSGALTTERFSRLFEDGDGRFLVYPLMLDAISERPWTGYGLGSFESAFRLFRDGSVTAFFDRGHNDYLEMIMDVGWPAALMVFLAVALLFIFAWYLSRRRTDYEYALLSVAATTQIAIHSSVDFSMQMPAVVFGYLCIALLGLAHWSHGDRSSVQVAEMDRAPQHAALS